MAATATDSVEAMDSGAAQARAFMQTRAFMEPRRSMVAPVSTEGVLGSTEGAFGAKWKRIDMIRHDYLREIGIDPVEKSVPWPFAVVVLGIIVAVVWITVLETQPSLSPPLKTVHMREQIEGL
jgi:hypothetical protein